MTENGNDPKPTQVPIQPVVILGFDPDGNFRFISQTDPPNTLYLLEKTKQKLLEETEAAAANKPKIQLARGPIPRVEN